MYKKFRPLIVSLLALLFTSEAIAQSEPKWTNPKPHPCYKGLTISVVNMGYAAGYYHWGVRITNLYQTTVAFRYKLIVGGKALNCFCVAFGLEKGKSHTEGNSYFNSISSDNPSPDWAVTIYDVCFEGMSSTCYGPNGCYADCDLKEGKENQQCDATGNQTGSKRPAVELSGTAPAPGEKKVDAGYKGEFTEWQQEGKDSKLTIGQDESGIYWKKKAGEPPVFFKNIRPGTFRYEEGSDFFIIRFESENRISFWNNGSLVGYFKRPEPVANKGKGFLVPAGDWSPSAKLEVVNGGISFRQGDIMEAKFYKQISPNEYKWFNPDGVHYCILKAVADKKLEETCGGASGSFGAGHFEYVGTSVKKNDANNKIPPEPKSEGTNQNTCKLSGKWKISQGNEPYFGNLMAHITCDGENFTMRFELIDGVPNPNFPVSTIIKGKKTTDYYDSYSNKSYPAWDLTTGQNKVCDFKQLVITSEAMFLLNKAQNCRMEFYKIN